METDLRKVYETLITRKIESWGFQYEKIEDISVLKYVYELYENNKYTLNCNDGLYLNYAGIYAEYCTGDSDLSEKYYLMAVDKGNTYSMYNLALHYYRQEKYDLVEKYYLMAIEGGDVNSMYNVAMLYYEQGMCDLAKKYLLMAINKGDVCSMNSMGLLYKHHNNFSSAEKYLLMAIEKGYVESMNNLARLYMEGNKYDLSEKYYLMAIENEDVYSMHDLAIQYSKEKNQELSRYYHIISALNNHGKSIKEINKILIYDFELSDSIKLINVLSDHNQNVLNDVLKFIENKMIWKLI